MSAIDRRYLLKQILPGAIAAAGVASVGLSLIPRAAEAIPLASDKTNHLETREPAEKAQYWGPRRRWGPRRYWGPPPRRRWWGRPRRVCWWRYGRRVCVWR